jgi:hypothetical protein
MGSADRHTGTSTLSVELPSALLLRLSLRPSPSTPGMRMSKLVCRSGYVSFYDIEDLGRPLTQEEEEQLAREGDGSRRSGWLSRVVRGLSFTSTASA